MEQPYQPAVDPKQVASIQKRLDLEAKLKGGLSWFFLIAGLSILNSLIYIMGESLTFVVGLGATQFIDGFAMALMEDLGPSTIVYIIWFFLDLGFASIFLGAGLLGKKGHRWAVIVGMIIYLLDAVLTIVFKDYLSFAFHALALWGLWRGLQALNNLKKLAQPSAIPSIPVLQ